MDSDFVFLDPGKIPPRRVANRTSWRGDTHVEQTGVLVPEEMEEDIPDFSLDYDPGDESARAALALVVPQAETFSAEDASLVSVDPLTEAIFESGLDSAAYELGSVSFSENGAAADRIADLADIKEVGAQSHREAILAELDDIDNRDVALSRKIARVESPSRYLPHKLAGAGASKTGQEIVPDAPLKVIRSKFYRDFPAEARTVESVSVADLEEWSHPADRFMAEDDWFRVGLAVPGRVSVRRGDVSKTEGENNLPPSRQPVDSDRGFKIFLAVFFAVLVPVTAGLFLFSAGPGGFVKWAIGAFNSKLLSSSGFILVNSQENSTFPRLAAIGSAARNAGLNPSSGLIQEFLESNSGFGWLNIFKKKVLGNNQQLRGLESLRKASEAVSAASAVRSDLKNLKTEFDLHLAWLDFWNGVVSPEKSYLVVLVDSAAPRPIGGRPVGYALVKANGGGSLDVLASGKFSALDAAAARKLVPPDPVKIVSTAWLPSEAGWFLDFEESAKTLSDFFTDATQTKVDGVVVITDDFLEGLAFKHSLVFDPESADWFYTLAEAISRKPEQRWLGLAETLEKGLAAHKVQFYFRDPALETFVKKSNWSLTADHSAEEDILGLGWDGLDSRGLALELEEYKVIVHQDGSVAAKVSAVFRQDSANGSRNYIKIYLPKGSEVLKAEGFDSREAIHDFDYAAKGFVSDPRVVAAVSSSRQLGDADVFEEVGNLAVGGWLRAPAGGRKTVGLEYVLPFRLKPKNGFANYVLKVLRPAQSKDAAFRFVAAPQAPLETRALTGQAPLVGRDEQTGRAGVEIVSLEPNGFVSENIGEYQGTLSGDLSLTASFAFSD